ncbi:hypothetical protein [Bacillus safensis]|uniref:hypothetical protein n=1 Tax=Bacillus safensis TaxID=561879 RepID=UPI0021E5C840|nr:hypothetical protein [Bacillus safensis]MCY7542465.1 hypothetical protein [Bacillus safensis]MCY7552584.1 hypothetical protein [Bacillus safensis]MCY7644771.1 hypothetical protein [Bacillus safensis]MCY7655914.1 hypothetical protein [Bacillus safensis]MEC3710389.1 hypothetical protein [Bacillus safensis]
MANVIIKRKDYQDINLKINVDKLSDMEIAFELVLSGKNNSIAITMNPSDLIQLRDKINETIFKLS